MLCPSTRATWNPNVTMSVAYTAAEASVFSHAMISSTTRSIRSEPPSIDRRVSGGAVMPPARAGTGSVDTSGSGTLSASAVGGAARGPDTEPGTQPDTAAAAASAEVRTDRQGRS